MEQKALICIGCPMGCMLQVEMEQGTVVSVSGNTCKRGESYARKEVTNPTRIVTSTVRALGGVLPVVSVKTKTDIPKEKIGECMRALKQITAQAPIHVGDVVVSDIAGTGVDVVATRELLEGD